MSDQSGPRSSVSRRAFVAGATATTLAASTPPVAAATQDETTVVWSFDPVAAQDNGDAIRRALHQVGGLADDITVEFVDAGYGSERRQRIRRQLAMDEPTPDLFLVDNAWGPPMAADGLLADLGSLLPEDTLETVESAYFDAALAPARDTRSGAMFALPLFVEVPTMLFRKDWVEEAGYSPEAENWATEPLTWQRWSQVTADVQAASDADYGWTTQWDRYEGLACCTFHELLTSMGGAYFGGRETLFGPVGDRPVTVDDTPAVDTLRMMRRFVHGEAFDGRFEAYAGDIAPIRILDWMEEGARQSFAAENAVMHRNWPYAVARSGRDPDESPAGLGTRLGVMPLPYGVTESEATAEGTGGPTPTLGGFNVVANPNTEVRDAVAQVLRAAAEPAFLLELLSIQGWLPPRPDQYDTQIARNADGTGRYMETFRLSAENAIPRPGTRVWGDQSPLVAETAHGVVAQNQSPAPALDTLAADLREIEADFDAEYVGPVGVSESTPAPTTTRTADRRTTDRQTRTPTTVAPPPSTETAPAGAETTAEDGPGFGLLSALAGLGIGAWAARRREE